MRPIFERLPEVYQSNPVADWLTRFADDQIELARAIAQNFPQELDPDTAAPGSLDYLGFLVGMSGPFWDVGWSETVKRDMIRYSHFLWSNRGTLAALQKTLDIHGIDANLWESTVLVVPFAVPATVGSTGSFGFIYLRLPFSATREGTIWKETDRSRRNFLSGVVLSRTVFEYFFAGFSVVNDPIFNINLFSDPLQVEVSGVSAADGTYYPGDTLAIQLDLIRGPVLTTDATLAIEVGGVPAIATISPTAEQLDKLVFEFPVGSNAGTLEVTGPLTGSFVHPYNRQVDLTFDPVAFPGVDLRITGETITSSDTTLIGTGADDIITGTTPGTTYIGSGGTDTFTSTGDNNIFYLTGNTTINLSGTGNLLRPTFGSTSVLVGYSLGDSLVDLAELVSTTGLPQHELTNYLSFSAETLTYNKPAGLQNPAGTGSWSVSGFTGATAIHQLVAGAPLRTEAETIPWTNTDTITAPFFSGGSAVQLADGFTQYSFLAPNSLATGWYRVWLRFSDQLGGSGKFILEFSGFRSEIVLNQTETRYIDAVEQTMRREAFQDCYIENGSNLGISYEQAGVELGVLDYIEFENIPEPSNYYVGSDLVYDSPDLFPTASDYFLQTGPGVVSSSGSTVHCYQRQSTTANARSAYLLGSMSNVGAIATALYGMILRVSDETGITENRLTIREPYNLSHTWLNDLDLSDNRFLPEAYRDVEVPFAVPLGPNTDLELQSTAMSVPTEIHVIGAVTLTTAVLLLEAENFENQTDTQIESYSFASGGRVVALAFAGPTSYTISTPWPYESGKFEATVVYYAENDGAFQFDLDIGQQAFTVSDDGTSAPSGVPTEDSRVELLMGTVRLMKGQVLTVVGTQTTGASFGRLDQLVFRPIV